MRVRDEQAKEAELTEYQNRVADARAGQQAGDQDIRVDTYGQRLSLRGLGHPDLSRTASALGADAPFQRRAAARPPRED